MLELFLHCVNCCFMSCLENFVWPCFGMTLCDGTLVLSGNFSVLHFTYDLVNANENANQLFTFSFLFPLNLASSLQRKGKSVCVFYPL